MPKPILTCGANRDGSNVGLAGCRGEVTSQEPFWKDPLCEWHAAKLRVFGGEWFEQAYYGGPGPGLEFASHGDRCGECGHTFFVR